MNDKQIFERAQEIAHEKTAACHNRPAHMAAGHGKSCKKLADTIAEAMREARDSVIGRAKK